MSEKSPWKGKGPGATVRASSAVAGLLAVASGIGAAFSAANGSFGDVLLLSVVAIYLAHFFATSVILWRSPGRDRAQPVLDPDRDGTPGLTFRYSRWAYYWMASMTAMNSALVALFGAYVLGAEEQPVGTIVAFVCFAGAAVLLWLLARMLYGAPGWLRLTPHGLEHRGLGFTHRLAWHQVVDVLPAVSHGTPLVIVAPAVTDRPDVTFTWLTRSNGLKRFGLPSMAVHGTWLASDLLLVFHALWHYHANPEHRTELSSEAALDRIRQRRFFLR